MDDKEETASAAENNVNETSLSDEDSESTTSEELEPKLKYVRMANGLRNILTNDSASCVAVHPKFVCVGTHWGLIHLLDHQGNNVRNRELRAHSVAVNQISIDTNGDYIASCSDDGKVMVFGLYSSDNDHDINLGRLVRSVSIDPHYYKAGSGRRFITGDERLVLHEKTFISRMRSTVLADASQEGGVKTMKWSPGGELLGWASHVGFRVLDLATRSSLGLVKWATPPQVDMKCYLCWKENFCLMVGWADTVWVCNVDRRTSVTPMDASVYVVRPVETFQTEFWICGVGPLESDNLVLLGCLKECEGERPQLHVVRPEKDDYTDLIVDSLSLRGYQNYSVDQYSLECLVDEGRFVVVSPKDIVVAYPYDADDRIDWLLHHGKFESALEAVSRGGKPVSRHTLVSVGRAYLDHLLAEQEFDHAALLCHKIIVGKEKRRWEKEALKFARLNQLRSVAEYLPYRPGEEEQLPSYVYQMVLYEYLKHDPEGFLTTVKRWKTPGLFDLREVVDAVLGHVMEAESKFNGVLLEALALLYSYSGKHDKALGMYIKLQNKGVFDLIRSHKLYETSHLMVKELMSLDSEKAVAVMLESKSLDPEEVVYRLANQNYYLYLFLDALDKRDTKSCQKYHSRLVQLYADFARDSLLPLLKKSDHFNIQEALNLCHQNKFHEEMVYLLGRIGNTQEALSLIMEKGNIERAIELCREHGDQDLWEQLINYSLSRPGFVTTLLKRIASYVDPRILVQRIDNHQEIDGLKPALVKMLHDYNLQVSVQEGCNAIIATDYFNLHERVVCIQQRGTLIGEDQLCGVCLRKFIIKNTKVEGNQPTDVMLFHCSHMYHVACMPVDAETCPVCTTKKNRLIV